MTITTDLTELMRLSGLITGAAGYIRLHGEELSAIAKDAERYRWLRNGGWEVMSDPKYWQPELRFDGAIDAGMADCTDEAIAKGRA